MKHLLLILIATVSFLHLTSCDSAIDKTIDCIDDDGPEFLTNALLPAATADLEYETEIVAAVQNEPRDDKFGYIFRLEGNLPDGVFLETFGFSRRPYLRGTPTQPGEYKFILHVEVVDINHFSSSSVTENLCFTRYREEFTLIVLPTP